MDGDTKIKITLLGAFASSVSTFVYATSLQNNIEPDKPKYGLRGKTFISVGTGVATGISVSLLLGLIPTTEG